MQVTNLCDLASILAGSRLGQAQNQAPRLDSRGLWNHDLAGSTDWKHNLAVAAKIWFQSQECDFAHILACAGSITWPPDPRSRRRIRHFRWPADRRWKHNLAASRDWKHNVAVCTPEPQSRHNQ
jgi:hypothetical protein